MKRPKRVREPVAAAAQPLAGRRTRRGTAEVIIAATDAQNEFGQVLDRAAGDDVIVITRHNVPRAVMISVDRYRDLAREDTRMLDTLSAEFDELLRTMQEPDIAAAIERGFTATPEEMGRAALAAVARVRSRGRGSRTPRK